MALAVKGYIDFLHGKSLFLIQATETCSVGSDDSGSQISLSLSQDGELEKLFTDMEQVQERLVGVIVTIFASGSYDENFREVRPETVPGEKVSTYSLSLFAVQTLQDYLSGKLTPEGIWTQLVEDIRSVPADSVTFNWECCGACSDRGFRQAARASALGTSRSRGLISASRSSTVDLIAFALQSGFSVMCSDFSLKALISEWSEELLGPNPFTRLPGTCDDQFQLEFFPEHLKNEDVPQQPGRKQTVTGLFFPTFFFWFDQNRPGGSIFIIFQKIKDEILSRKYPKSQIAASCLGISVACNVCIKSRQLQVVGELCAQDGKAAVGALSDTILYTLNPRRKATQVYQVKVLTVVTKWRGSEIPEAMKCEVQHGDVRKRGVAGHVALSYPSGGQLITSMGHWIELTRINTSVESMMQVAARNFGEQEIFKHRAELSSARNEAERQQCVQKLSKQMIQKSVPSSMKARTKF